MRSYVLVEKHGETDAVANLVARLASERAPALLPFAPPIRAPGIDRDDQLLRYLELVRRKPDAASLLVLRDDEDGCPKLDAPRIATLVRSASLPFPAAVTLAFREFESIFLPCIDVMAGRPLPGVGGARPGLRADAKYEGEFEAKRGVKEWLTSQMPEGRAYKPTLDQLAFTRMVDFEQVRRSKLPWFGSLQRAIEFLGAHVGQRGVAYPEAHTPGGG